LWLLLLQLLLGITTIPIAVPVTTIRATATGAVQGVVLLIILVSTVMIVVLLVALANHLAIMATVAPRFVQTPRTTAWVVKLRRWQQQQAANLKQQLMHMRIEECFI